VIFAYLDDDDDEGDDFDISLHVDAVSIDGAKMSIFTLLLKPVDDVSKL
jgi:hypothetical protein